MTAPKFTPGPWHVEHPYGEPGTYVVAPSTALISKLYHVDTIDEHRGVSIEANAHLCAAAPELYAALLELHDYLDEHVHGLPMMVRARAALGKAVPS